jgi:hypothetical protein
MTSNLTTHLIKGRIRYFAFFDKMSVHPNIKCTTEKNQTYILHLMSLHIKTRCVSCLQKKLQIKKKTQQLIIFRSQSHKTIILLINLLFHKLGHSIIVNIFFHFDKMFYVSKRISKFTSEFLLRIGQGILTEREGSVQLTS